MTTTYPNCTVTSVTDGDTFKCRPNGGTAITVRVRLIDTPEKQTWYRKSDGTWQPAECWGKEAASAAYNRLIGKVVTVVSHGLDAHGRHLGDVLMADGSNFNHWMLDRGHAAVSKMQKGYLDPEDAISWAAREAKRGMWGACSKPGHNGRLPMAPLAVEPAPAPEPPAPEPEPEPEPEPHTCPTCGQLWARA